jgi:hypothetical protein
MSRIIYNVENRGSAFIYHWFIFMIAGLRHIKDKKPTFGTDGIGRLERNTQFYNLEIDNPPYRIYISNEFGGMFSYPKNDYQQQSIELLKDDFIFIEKSEINEDDIIINNYGEPLYFIDGDDAHNSYVSNLNDPNSLIYNSKDGYQFLRDLDKKVIITEDDVNKYKNKKFFLSRSKSHLLEGNSHSGQIKRRQIINEIELQNQLKEYDVDFIFLEDYTLEEKIKIFKLSSLIISPNSGGLIFSLYSNESTNIVELNVETPHQISKQYYDICYSFNIPYTKFICDKIDQNDNMYVNINEFILLLKNKKLI